MKENVLVLFRIPFTGEKADKKSRNPSISADGRFVAFESEAKNLIPGGIRATAEVCTFTIG